ncbi:MAG: aminotransferase class I/II-fold pyridoxal phosphate-dependent enzyme, partial [Gammaproteobacteria bacterium]|nr:aminotransferase class I/II-fold pyridoxal phosphate-dependent enzyme [Gammaproteobacteria bacterium]
LAALEDAGHVQHSVRMNHEGMRRITGALTAMGVDYLPSVTNFLCVRVGRDAAGVYQALLREGVIVRPVANYGLPEYLRVTVGQPRENERFLGALKKTLDR